MYRKNRDKRKPSNHTQFSEETITAQGPDSQNEGDVPSFLDEYKQIPITGSLSQNEKQLQQLFTDCFDLVLYPFDMRDGKKAFAFYIDGLTSTQLADEAVKALMVIEGNTSDLKHISSHTLPVSQVKHHLYYYDLLLNVLNGEMGLLVEDNAAALSLGIQSLPSRSIDEPASESVLRGAREGFVENFKTNTSLLRKKLKTPRLKMKPLVIGRHSNTNVVIAYIDNIVDFRILKELESRLERINIDSILESGYIEEFIEDVHPSPFPQIQNTERPDVVASALLEGRFAVIIDGSPFVLLLPTVFWHLMHASEDYFERPYIGILIRWLRYAFLLISLWAPALYVAVTTFHHDMLPTPLLLSISAARENIPFPAVIEALLMEITFEALREAGVRLPKTIGQTISILGAIVVGTSAVEAGIVSAPMVIIVAITGIASFTAPSLNVSITLRMMRFPFLFAASMFGIYGILLGNLILLGHLATLRSFGIPYFSPVMPLSVKDLKDVFWRTPWPLNTTRPGFIPVQDNVRQRSQKEENNEDHHNS